MSEMPRSASSPVQIQSLATPADAIAFREINQEWIGRLFTVTEADRMLLEDPLGRIVQPGGDVLIAQSPDSSEIVGCVALIAYPDQVMELSKMAVSPAAQGHGVGRLLVDAAIERARELKARRLFLGTNTKLAPAIHLYEEAGFRRIGADQLPVADYYARADILMELPLDNEINT